MDKEYQIAYVDEPEWGTIGRGIRDFNIQQAGNDNYQNLCYVLSTAD